MENESFLLELLEHAGVKKGHKVLDFGCGSGTYAIPAARIVGDEGRVYALDKNSSVLNELLQKVNSAEIKNIERIDADGKTRIELADSSVDVVLVFDVLHSYYFPRVEDRRRLLDEIHRVAKADAIILVYPKHMEADARDEIERAGFYLQSEHTGTLVHDNRDLEQGHILLFTRKPKS
jgi:ubiquinone/menaquinone biosynthesis C-methylase UbiE